MRKRKCIQQTHHFHCIYFVFLHISSIVCSQSNVLTNDCVHAYAQLCSNHQRIFPVAARRVKKAWGGGAEKKEERNLLAFYNMQLRSYMLFRTSVSVFTEADEIDAIRDVYIIYVVC